MCTARIQDSLDHVSNSPLTAVARQKADPRLPDGPGERFALHGIMGLAFAGGHYLALRYVVASSIGPGYRSVWHRDPAGRWSMFTTTEPELSCPRYFGSTVAHVEQVPRIDVSWGDLYSFVVRIESRLTWRVRLGATFSTRMVSRLGRAMPPSAWRNQALLATVGPAAGPTLHTGRIRLSGTTINGQHFRAAPVRIWRVADSSAVFDGTDLGRPGPLDDQTRLGDFWLPQRGIFVVGSATFHPHTHL